jgi:hypothetical protein
MKLLYLQPLCLPVSIIVLILMQLAGTVLYGGGAGLAEGRDVWLERHPRGRAPVLVHNAQSSMDVTALSDKIMTYGVQRRTASEPALLATDVILFFWLI